MGGLDFMRDWGFAGDYVRAMWLMLQQDDPADFVIATGVRHSVRELLDTAFSYVDLDYEDYVSADFRFVRAVDVIDLAGDASKACRELDWEPKVTFEEWTHMKVDHDPSGKDKVGDGRDDHLTPMI